MLYIELAFVALLILGNGLLAMAELAVVSSRRARLQALVDRQIRGSRRALALASNPGKFLSTVQIGITLVGVLSGAISGATLGTRLAEWLAWTGLPAGVADAAGIGAVVATITYVSLIIGELVPKQIALRDPEGIAVRVAPAMTLLAKVASPLVTILDISGRLLLRITGQKGQREEKVSDQEIHALIAEAETAGVLEPTERAMISGVMRLGDRTVRAVMTSRVDVDMIDLTDEPSSIRSQILKSKHTRLPAHEGTPDAIVGVIHAKDLLNAFLQSHDPDVRGLVRQGPVIPDTADALDAVEMIKKSSIHIALIVDEYGHFEGVVTNADILEAIVGQFGTDEGPIEPAAVRRGDGSWLISGSMPADEMAERLFFQLPEGRTYQTAAGFVLSQTGRLATIGDSFEFDRWRFEVIDVDGRRIDKLLVSQLPGERARRAATTFG
jgi:putative hemolysin